MEVIPIRENTTCVILESPLVCPNTPVPYLASQLLESILYLYLYLLSQRCSIVSELLRAVNMKTNISRSVLILILFCLLITAELHLGMLSGGSELVLPAVQLWYFGNWQRVSLLPQRDVDMLDTQSLE